MRITFLCQYFPPEMGAPAARTWEHTREWVAQGHAVTVVTGFPNHPTGILQPGYQGKILMRESPAGIDLLRTWVYCAPNKGFFRRSLNFLSFFGSSLLFGGLLTPRPDVVIGTSPQFFCAVAAYLLSGWKRVPFVFEVRDIWPQSAIELGAIRNRLLIRLLEAMEGQLYRRARLIIIVAESTRPYLLAKGVPAEKIALIPNGIDEHFLKAASRDPAQIRAEYGWQEKFLVGYIGTHGMSHALATVLDAAERLQMDPSIHFLFVGEGAEKEELTRLARERCLTNVTFLPAQPREELAAFYRACDIGLVPLRRLPIFRKVLPSKLFEWMGVGCPVICSVEGEAAQLVEASKGGQCIEPESVEALVSALRRLQEDPTRRAEMGSAGAAFVKARYTRAHLAQDYLRVVCERISSSSPARS
jgi:colanic acid biosynthesis glycosyl transferase WcaI